MRGKERDNSPFPLPHSPSFFLRLLHDLNAWNYTQAPWANPPSLCCNRAPTPPALCNVVPLFELPLGNYKHSNFWMEDGGSMDYFVLLGDSASTILSACITGALWAKQGERGILREAPDEVRRILAIPTLVSRFQRKMPRSIELLYFVNSYSFLSVVGGCDRDRWGSNATWQSIHPSKWSKKKGIWNLRRWRRIRPTTPIRVASKQGTLLCAVNLWHTQACISSSAKDLSK